MEKQEITDLLSDISFGLFRYSTDFILFGLYFGLNTIGTGRTQRDFVRTLSSSLRDVHEFNIFTFERAFADLKRRGFIKVTKNNLLCKPKITAAGEHRLKNFLPSYDSERAWDGRIYLITYDILEEQRIDRELLRRMIKKLGCGKLQASVYLTPYNPSGVLQDFIKEKDLSGSVLVSNLGADSSIGEEDLQSLLVRVYNLESLNFQYREFIKGYAQRSSFNSGEKQKMAFHFFSILKSDPQLPFPLLPREWLGDRAYHLFHRKLDQS